MKTPAELAGNAHIELGLFPFGALVTRPMTDLRQALAGMGFRMADVELEPAMRVPGVKGASMRRASAEVSSIADGASPCFQAGFVLLADFRPSGPTALALSLQCETRSLSGHPILVAEAMRAAFDAGIADAAAGTRLLEPTRQALEARVASGQVAVRAARFCWQLADALNP